jgi:uncharacterized protein
VLVLVVALALSFAPSLAPSLQEVPRNDGWVTDQAGLLSPAQEQELEDLMESYKQGSGHELALLTVKSLGGRPIEDLALATAREWGVSGKEKNDGALLVVASEDKRMRFEVGQGLEDELPDAICGRIIRDVMAPEFREGRFYDGIRKGIVSAHEAIGGDYGSIEAQPRGGGAAAICPVLFLFLFVLLAAAGRRGSRGGTSMTSGGGLLQSLLLASLFQNAGRSSGWHGGSSSGQSRGGFGGFSGFGGGGASGGW